MNTVYIYLQDLEASFERPFDKIYKIRGTKQKKWLSQPISPSNLLIVCKLLLATV